ncbi:DNA-binding LytR/AlgR family response regulator [Chitinophaga dinghuensis]|uniref:DNA-binding LytR/AlgR family response regulator n=1 Tax=Chitinophaga dinghuensis TaxID=1539050 RepID=A0A327WCQ4_9BACT|nr:response regulator transcription factor [Chitinophaga dinghuensis]RAJ88019.1 DNA-binding LytR/AlgR family response regulator [Chitinophaga dinghuensis]
MQLECIIIEDEPLSLEKTAGFVAKVPYLKLAGTFYSSMDALQYLKEHKTDLIFLDIEMEGLTGIELLQSLQQRPAVIITSAFEKYALKGYELNVVDYLLKPFDFPRFLQAVDKVAVRDNVAARTERNFFMIQHSWRTQKVCYQDVLYIEGMREYRCIYTAKEKILTLQSFIELEQMLDATKICRIHKSWMVNVEKVEFIEKGQVKIGDKFLPLSETYKSGFYKVMGLSESGER